MFGSTIFIEARLRLFGFKSLSDPLSLADRLYIWLFYRLRAFNYDLPENKVGWRSRQNQELRFKALAAIGDLGGRKILDLGCGLGCFYGYLNSQGWKGDYTGIDILGLMVEGARKRFPGVRFEKRDILRNPLSEKWDYVVINGLFNHKVRDNWSWIEQMVLQTMKASERGLAFSLLNLEGGWMDSDLFYADPVFLEEKLKLWSRGNYKIIKDYLPEDLTAYLYH